jgi:hypothetical protein
VVRHIKFLLWRSALCGADFDRRSSQAKFCRKAPHNLKRASSLILVLAWVFIGFAAREVIFSRMQLYRLALNQVPLL